MREFLFGGQLARRIVLLLALTGVVAVTAGTATAARQGLMPRQTSPVVFTGAAGTGPPPAVLGGIFMTPFAQLGGIGPVTMVPAPFGGNLLFGTAAAPQTLSNETVGVGWATWSNGYTGDVFTNFTAGGSGSQDDSSFVDTLTMPAGVHAFYLYAEPNSFGLHRIRATATGSTGTTASSGWIPVEGDSGAQFYGFYTTNSFVTLTKIVVTAAADTTGFAIGEFGQG